MKKLRSLAAILGVIGLFTMSASYRFSGNAIRPDDTLTNSPVLSPEESMKQMVLEEGFKVQLVAAEPLVRTPVAMVFDDKGRMWVAEMDGYMPDTLGSGEEFPHGKIVILEDTNKDGIMDNRKVFLDSLILPRGLCLIENGILVAESPNLWFFEINSDKPGKKVLVDGNYTDGGNVEHEPNGLMRALDNWIYNAKSAKRYRKNGDAWLIEKTHFRGQWGITQDNYGRLYYNNNSQNLIGEFFSPGFGSGNSNLQRVAGFNENVVKSNRVYPIRPTPGVNRGYQDGVLDKNMRLVNFTAACGPVVYRGNLFSKEYENNAFVAEPAANLIKRNILEESAFQILGKQAYTEKEFLASKDERFRPVNLYNGPDGAMYVVDMYRGIIQHRTYITGYLKGEVKKRDLTTPSSLGRIYKVVPSDKKAIAATLSTDPKKLVTLLQHPNGWVRDKAQQLLVDKKSVQVLPALRKLVKNPVNPLTTIHALWTIEGLQDLQSSDLMPLLANTDAHIRAQALTAVNSVLSRQNFATYVAALDNILDQKDESSAPYIAFLAQSIQNFDPATANRLRRKAVSIFPKNNFVSDAVVSGIQNSEAEFEKELIAANPDTGLVIRRQLQRVLTAIKTRESARNTRIPPEREFSRGVAIYRSICQACHGSDGNGVTALAPPLNNSEWVTGDKTKLASIILYGLSGPISVNGKVYKSPEINGDMPALGQNIAFGDEDIASLLSFIRNSWNNNAERVSAADISAVRRKFPSRQKSFTMDELNQIK